MQEPILSVPCAEKKGTVIRSVYEIQFDSETLRTFYNKAAQFPVIFGKKLTNVEDFTRIFFTERDGKLWSTGLFWKVDDFVGMFYLTEIFPEQADAHFTFFDKKLEGREELTREMMRYVFREFPSFVRLNVSLPAYVNDKVFQFVDRVGFKIEGKKRKCALWKGKWFDSIQYGILRSEILTEPTTVEDLKNGSQN